MDYKNYEKTRFSFNRERKVVWREITRFISKYLPDNPFILDLGSGYCDFVNSVKGRKKYALDKYINPERFALSETIPLYGDYGTLNKKIPDNSLDVVFASNFIEHLSEKDLEKYISIVYKKLKNRGLFIALQPNFKYSYREYFDDYTHLKAWTDVSLGDYLKSKGLITLKIWPKFLPFSMKKRLPKIPLLIRFYLYSPLKPFAKQMLIITRKK